MARTEDITSFTDYRKRLREHLDQARDSGRPLFVTTNGQVDAVVLSAEAYDRLLARAEGRPAAAGAAEAAAGSPASDLLGQRLAQTQDALRSLADELGIRLGG